MSRPVHGIACLPGALGALLALPALGLQAESSFLIGALRAESAQGFASQAMIRRVSKLLAEDRVAALAPDGVWLQGARRPEREFPVNKGLRATYGFYLHTYEQQKACIELMKDVRKTYPDAPVYIMSDGGANFTGLCDMIGNCRFAWKAPANDRWNPKPFMDRFREAAVWLRTKFVVYLEPDVEVVGRLRKEPGLDAGGVKDSNPPFGQGMRQYVEAKGRIFSGNPDFELKWTRFGLAGSTYYRLPAILDTCVPENYDWAQLRQLDSKRVWSSDVFMALALATHGFVFHPWDGVSQMRTEKFWGKPKAPPAFRHYGRDEDKPFYNVRLTRQEEEQLVGPKIKAWKDPQCQGCIWVEEDDCWTNPSTPKCPTTEHDAGPPEWWYRRQKRRTRF